MPHRTSYEPGTPSWVDLGTPDVEAATAFNTELFRWTAEPMTDEAGPASTSTRRCARTVGTSPDWEVNRPGLTGRRRGTATSLSPTRRGPAR